MSVKNRPPKADLYQFVFGYRPLRLMIVAMFIFFVMHPVMPAFASQLSVESISTESVLLAETESAIQGSQPELSTEPESIAGSSDSENQELIETFYDDQAETVEGDIVSDEIESEPEQSDVAVEELVTLPPSNSSAAGDAPAPASANVIVNDVATTSDMLESVTVPEPEFYEVVTTVDHTTEHYQFNKHQCVSMGNGAYHCFDADEQGFATEATALSVERDSDGDKEIYLTTPNGTKHKITDNKVDDDAPYYDAISDSIVWHRLVDGRHQIVSYKDKTETVLSEGYQNSMEPNRSGAYTVWQSWVNGAWQVVLHDGQTDKVISNTAGQNIAPQVEGDYVIWNVTNGSSHTVAVYEIATGLVSLIDDTEGARVSNPRFVLVYDTRFANGDVITKGYDADTGTVVPLGAAAPIVPEQLPSSDQTGEVRALLQNKAPSRDDSIENLETGSTTSPNASSTTASSTVSTPEVIAGVTTDATLTVPATSTIPNLPLTDFDIVVTPYATTTSSQ